MSAPVQAEWWACHEVNVSPQVAANQTIRIEKGKIYRYEGDVGEQWNFPQSPDRFDDDLFQEGKDGFKNGATILNADRATWRIREGPEYLEFTIYRKAGSMTSKPGRLNDLDWPNKLSYSDYSCNAISDPRQR